MAPMVIIIPEWMTVTNFLIGLFGFVVLIIGALVVLILRSKSEVSTIQVDRAVAAEALVKTKEEEKVALKLKIEQLEEHVNDLEEELESVTAEHRTLVGLNIGKLMQFWEQKEELEAKLRDMEKDLRIEKRRRDGDGDVN